MPVDQSPVRAAIDIGSNTIHIVVAHSTATNLDILADEVDLVRIGESVTTSGSISEQKRDEAIAVIQRYRQLAEQHGAENILVVATEAIRVATNSGEFLEHVQRETGLPVHLIEGDVEAVLTFYGATYETLKKCDLAAPLAVMDLGGGSTELITAQGTHITWLTSIPIGSGWLHDRYLPSDPPAAEELGAARAFLQDYLQEMQIQQEPTALIATGGSANSLLFLAQRADFLDASTHHLTVDALKQCEELLTSSHAEEIAERYGQPVERTRILPAGCLIIQAMMARFHLAEIQVSPHGIREGTLLAFERYGEHWLEHVQEEASELNQEELATSDSASQDHGPATNDNQEATPLPILDSSELNKQEPATSSRASQDNEMASAAGPSSEPFAGFGQRLLHERLDKLLDWRDDILKQEDIEAVHKMRVASRRLRAVLDAYEPCCKVGRFKMVYREVKGMADLLGAARDTDVMIQRLQEQCEQAPYEEQAGLSWLIERLRAYREQKQKALVQYFARLDQKTLKRLVESCLPKGAANDG